MTDEERSLVEAFQEVSTDRQIGFSVGPVPYSAIERYATRHGFDDPDDFDLLRRSIRAMDAVYLTRLREKSKAEGK